MPQLPAATIVEGRLATPMTLLAANPKAGLGFDLAFANGAAVSVCDRSSNKTVVRRGYVGLHVSEWPGALCAMQRILEQG